MSREKDRKRIIRARTKTGESAAAGRARIVSQSKPKPASTPRSDLAGRAGKRDEVIAAKTGRTWREWVTTLDDEGASTKRHGEIAALVRDRYGVGEWWAQTVTVGYERIKGLREAGQRLSGEYEVNKSRTLPVPVDTLFAAWADGRTRARWLDRVTPVVRTATKPKAIRLQWPDGTIVIAGFTAKGAVKSAVAVQHTKLRDKAAAERAKRDWTERLDALASLLGSSAR